jgi:hypothetical protein
MASSSQKGLLKFAYSQRDPRPKRSVDDRAGRVKLQMRFSPDGGVTIGVDDDRLATFFGKLATPSCSQYSALVHTTELGAAEKSFMHALRLRFRIDRVEEIGYDVASLARRATGHHGD